jgi:autotransporter-associated beta strand protein
MSILAVFLGIMAACLGSSYSAADTFSWTGNSPPIPMANNWSNPLNWQGAQIPPKDGTADVIIPDTPRDNHDVDTPWSIKSLTFEGAGNYSLNEDPLTLNDVTHDGTGTVTFNNSLGVSGTNARWRAASGPMRINGAITGSNQLEIEAPQPITFDGSAANTLTGAVVVTEGTLILSKSSFNGSIAGNLQAIAATVRWDAPDQVSNLPNSQVILSNGSLADLNGHDETLSQLILAVGSRVQSTGGRLTVTGQLGLQDTAEIDLGAGELQLQAAVIRSGSSASTSRIAANRIMLTGTQNLFFAADSPAEVELEVAGELAGSTPAAFLQKADGGALRLTSASTYHGGTTVAAGTLIVDNATGSGTGTGTVTVQTGALLTGDGVIAGQVGMQNGARISPQGSTGFPIGSLTVGNLSMNTTSVFEAEFNQALPITSRRDVLTVTNNASLNGNLVLENLNASVLPPSSATFTILSAGTLSGSFANAPNGSRLDTIDGSGSFLVNYGSGSAFNPNHVVLSDFMAEGLAGDFDSDGDVDGADFLVWQRGGSPTPMSSGDLAVWKSNYGATGGIGAVPETGAGMLAALGFAAVAIRGRRSVGNG